MTEIIAPKFARSLKHKLRLLKEKPELARLPEFQVNRPLVPTIVAITLFAALLFRRR